MVAKCLGWGFSLDFSGFLGPELESQACLFLIGISWKDKVADLRLKMAERNIVWFVVTALDEIACECSGFTAWECNLISSFGSLGICVFLPFSFLSGQGNKPFGDYVTKCGYRRCQLG